MEFSLAAVLLLLLLVLVVYKCFIYPHYLSPLSKVPNAHATASFMPIWILWVRYRHVENRVVHDAHQRLGPIIRLGPNEISVNSVDGGIRTVYSGGFDKPEWYLNHFANYGIPNMFSTLLSKAHSTRKRMLSNIYSKSYIHASPHMAALAQTVLHDRLLPLISRSASARTPLDVYSVVNATAMDFVTAYLFGLPNSTNFFREEANRDEWIRLYMNRRPYMFWAGELPNLQRFLATVGVRVVPRWVDAASRDIEAFCMNMCDAADKAVEKDRQSGEDSLDGEEPVVYKQLKQAMDKGNSKAEGAHKTGDPDRQRMEIASEMLDHLVAGIATTGTTLTYLFWELSRNPAIQLELRHELRTLSPPLTFPTSKPNLPPPKVLDSLPFLQACIMETLRLHPALPGGQPRTTPPNAIIGPYTNLPANVRVSAQAYSLHRNTEVFPEPEEWRPHRWLDEDAGEKHRWFWAFGSGGRMCVGSNFAMYEMKLVVAAVYTNFSSEIVDDSGIEQDDGYTCGPKGGRLMLGFSPAGT